MSCGALSDVCREAGSHLPEEELRALQVGKAAEEAREAMHALHGLKGLTTCTDEHSWAEVSKDLVGCVPASMIALVYINGPETRDVFDEVFRRRTRRGREAASATS